MDNRWQAFNKKWFQKHQAKLLWFLNFPMLSFFVRWFLNLDLSKRFLGKKIIEITPNTVKYFERYIGKDREITADIREGSAYAVRIYFRLKYFWLALHWWDTKIANPFVPALNLGFDTLGPLYSAAGANSPVDGYVYLDNAVRGLTNPSIRDIRNETTGTEANNTIDDGQWALWEKGSGDSAVWVACGRPIHKFDLSAIGATPHITAATFSVYGTDKSIGSGNVDGQTNWSDIGIVEATTAGDDSLAVADYNTDNFILRTLATYMGQASWSSSAYNDFALNNYGLNLLSNKKAGIVTLAGMMRMDIEFWSPGSHSLSENINRYNIRYADYTGTSNDPKLVVTYTDVTSVDAASYTESRKITIDNTKVAGAANLTDFTVCISGTYDGTGGEPDLRTTGNGGDVTSASGFDIEFSDVLAGTTKYPHELVKYDGATGAVEIHVKIPTVDFNDDTDFYMHIGNEAVTAARNATFDAWDQYTEEVFHFQDSVVSSIGGISATNSGADQADAKVNRGFDFVRANSDYVNLNFRPGNPGINYTFSLWLNMDAVNANYRISQNAAPNPDYDNLFIGHRAWLSTGSYFVDIQDDDGNVLHLAEPAASFTAATWYWMSAVIDKGTTVKLYQDGTEVASDTDPTNNKIYDTDYALGTYAPGVTHGAHPDALMDEIRFAKTNRSAGWLETEYNNMNSPSTFYSIGAGESAPTPSSAIPAPGGLNILGLSILN